jgi:ATP-dependent Clp protease ATP-binding subunit ClpB
MSEEARTFLANEGYDPQFGARPLKRVIQKEVENRIARAILDGTIHDGATVNINVVNNKLIISPEQ